MFYLPSGCPLGKAKSAAEGSLLAESELCRKLVLALVS